MLFLTTLLISIIITIAIMPYSRELALKLQAMDKPNHRKIHDAGDAQVRGDGNGDRRLHADHALGAEDAFC